MTPERVFADINLFLRYLTNDIPTQADAVERLLQRATAGEIILVINSLVVAEIVWTLESFYGLGHDSIKDNVLAIINTPGIELADSDLILQAISWYAEKNVDYIDAFNAVWLLDREMSAIYTFEQKHLARFEQLRVQTP